MATIKDYFDINELVCPHVYKAHGEKAWNFFDPRLLAVLLYIREGIGKPIYVNSYPIGGNLTQRGFRCNLCQLVADKTKAKTLYASAHMRGMAVDFSVTGMTADAVRTWIKQNANRLPHPVRLEEGVTWVHLDVCTDGSNGIVTTFKA